MRFPDTGTRLRGVTGAGEYGNPAAIDWTEGTLSKVDYPCNFQPDQTTENVQAQQRTETRWRVFLPAAADITAKDRFRFLGVDYEVDGDIERHRIRGAEHHVEFRALKVTGG